MMDTVTVTEKIVKIKDVWVRPAAIDALRPFPGGVVLTLRSGAEITIVGIQVAQVVDILWPKKKAV